MEREDDLKWVAVQTRDASKDGTFVYAVITTRIYCRPSCPSPHPKRQNVVFFETAKKAQMDGFRACRRCGAQTDRNG